MINGAERVIVSQLVRSPGVYYSQDVDTNSRPTYNATIIPNRGAWIEFETDTVRRTTRPRVRSASVSTRIARSTSRPSSARLSRPDLGLDWEGDEAILSLFNDSPLVSQLHRKRQGHQDPRGRAQGDLQEAASRRAPRMPRTPRSFWSRSFFDEKRYDLAGVGRYKLNGNVPLTASRIPTLTPGWSVRMS